MNSETLKILNRSIQESPRGKFLEVTSYFCKTPDYTNYVFYDDIRQYCIGGFTLCAGNLSFLTDEENYLHCAKLQNIFIKEEARGGGIFGGLLEALKDFAEDNGVFLYMLARAFKLKMPVIKRPEEYIRWIQHHNDDIEMQGDKDTEWVQSKRLLDTYKRHGFCSFTAYKEDVSQEKWLENLICGGTDNVKPELQEVLTPLINCEDEPTTWKDHVLQMNNEKRQRNKKRRKEIRRRNSSRKSA